uniref:Uncharacterized protein n=1 Tax=Rhizophora mucronata TaxID=61149 RepID=A0A2P2PWH0_RHIMU
MFAGGNFFIKCCCLKFLIILMLLFQFGGLESLLYLFPYSLWITNIWLEFFMD